MSDVPATVEIRPAATILLLRDDPAFQVLMVERHHEIDFAAGALVFPGGKTQGGDHDPAWADHALDWARFDPLQRALRIAAVREVFEEAGVLLARGPDGAPLAGEACSIEARRAVDAGSASFLEVVAGLGARLDLPALTVFARWITPSHMTKRFDTWFYAAKAPAGQLAACDGRETVDAQWVGPTEALALGEAGRRKVIFPTRMNLRLLAEAAGADDVLARAAARPLVTVEPRLAVRPEGKVLILPPDAGYGPVEEPLARAGA